MYVNIRCARGLLHALASVIALISSSWAHSATVSLCEAAEIAVLHPAEFVQETVRRHGLSCLLNPVCCTPAWMTSPDCYVIQRIKKKDPWTEIKKTFTCKDYQLSARDAFEKWLANLQSPVPGFHIIPSELTSVFAGYVGDAYDAGNPLPQDIMPDLNRLADTDRAFSRLDLSKARILPSSHPLAKKVWPGGAKWGAITYYNLIVYRPEFNSGTRCERAANWAHELTHVHQYSALGWEAFLERYLLDGINGYDNIPFEKMAYAEQQSALQQCTSWSGGCLPACAGAQTCVSGKCIGQACTPACKAPQTCQNGRCVAPLTSKLPRRSPPPKPQQPQRDWR